MIKVKLIPLIIFIYFLTGCKYEIIRYELEDKTVIFNNEEHSITYDKELNDTTVTYENNAHTNAGVYEVKAKFTYKDESYESTALLTILPKEIDELDFNYNTSIIYNGLNNQIEITNLPNNITYYFKEENSYYEIGEYYNTIIFESNNSNYLNSEVNIKFNIMSNEELDILFNTSFQEKDLIFNNEYQSIKLINEEILISYGYEIKYINNTNKNVGTYEVSAIITKDSITHEVTTIKVIKPKVLIATFTSNTSFYESESYEITIDIDVEVEYIYYKDDIIIDKPTTEGTYTVVANFLDNNYSIDSITKEFNIILDHSILDNTVFESKEIVYNYNSNSIYLSNEKDLINLGYNIIYINNNHTNIGEYVIQCIVTKSNFIIEYTAILSIKPLPIVPSINNLIFNENDVNIEIDYQIDHSKKFYDIEGNKIDKPSEVGLYKVEILFNDINYEVNNIEEYFIVILTQDNIDLINKSTIDNTTYNNNLQTVILNTHDELIENNFIIEYENNDLLFSGIYEVKVIITKGMFIKELLLEVEVYKLEITPTFIPIDKIIEGSAYHFHINENIEADVQYTYYKNNIEVNKPSTYGSYIVKAYFYNYSNDIIINDIYLEFNIYFNNYTQSLIDNTILEDKEVVFNNEKQFIQLNNHRDLLLERFNITYTYNDNLELPIDIGIYEVVATISKNNEVIKQLNATLIINPS